MKRVLALGFGLVLFVGSAVGQGGGGRADVSAADWRAALVDTEPSMSRVAGVKPFVFGPVGSGAVSRGEVLEDLERLMEHYRPVFRVTPRPLPVVAEAVEGSGLDAAGKERLEKLVRWGFVAPVGPLAWGEGRGLTGEEAGDALGFFYARVALLTTQPDPKWTPALQPE